MLDEAVEARWLDDELQGVERAAFEASIQGNTDLLAKREEVRNWRATLATVMPAAVEPPYPEFFNSRIARAIREHNTPVASAIAASWRGWWLPAAALAGMVLAFWVGTKAGGTPQAAALPSEIPRPVLVVARPTIYTPEHGVDAEWFSSTDAAATVIVLEGVDAIPDTLDFPDTAGLPRQHDFSASVENFTDGEIRQR